MSRSNANAPVLMPSPSYYPQHSTPSVHTQRRPPRPAPAPRVAAYGSKIINLSWQKRLRQAPTSMVDPLVADYNQTFFGIDDPATRPSVCEYFASKPAIVSDFFALSDLFGPSPDPPLEWKAQLPSHSELLRTPFGRPSPDASFTQTACFETAVFNVFKSGFLDLPSFDNLCACHPLLRHMARLIPVLAQYDFTWLRDYDSDWASYSEVPARREMAFLALVFHYDLHLSAAVRYLGERFTGSYRDADTICALLAQHDIPPDLIEHFRRVITHGGPAHLNSEVSRDNTLLYWREGNATSILQYEHTVRKTMAKEMRNSFCFPLPAWTTRFMKHIFLTPLHILLKDDKARMIFNAKLRHNEDAVSLNMMTSTHLGVELECGYGTVYQRIFERLYNLRISYPDDDLVIHANDIKSCFRQIKHHPDVVGGFCYVLFEHLWVQVGLTFGSDFSPQNWEPCRRVLELLAQSLFHDTSLRDKHRKYLDQILWCDSLSSRKARRQRFVRAFRDSKNPGVMGEDGTPAATPHHVFVDDGIYADVYDIARVEQALAASIEAIFILLGESDLRKRQDPISFEKMCELLVAPFNKILGLHFDLRRLTVGPPPEFIAKTLSRLAAFHGGRRSFQVKEMSELLGMLQHIANSSRWLNHILSHLYTSLGAALGSNKAYLLNTSKAFREALATATSPSAKPSHRSFAQSATARQVHSSQRSYFLNATAKEELHLIRAALLDDTIPKYSPIAFLVPRDPNGTAWGDSCLYAAGGYSIDMKFWWYVEWPSTIVEYTLLYMRNHPEKGKLISINALEYATVIINYCAALLYFQEVSSEDVHPTVHINADNTSAESWASSGCKRGLLMGRALGRLQCALMLRNSLGLTLGHVTTTENWIADEISRVKRELDSLTSFCSLISKFPQLSGCRRYRPSAAVLSAITDALLTQKMHDPVALSQQLLSDLGSFTTCASVPL